MNQNYIFSEISKKMLALCCITLLFAALLPNSILMAQTPIDLKDYNVIASDPPYWSCNGSGGYTITESVTVIYTGVTPLPALTFNISSGATVQWTATATTALSGTNTYFVTITGSGTLELSSCTVSSTTGTSGVFNLTGSGTTVTIGEGASVVSGRSGYPIQISGNSVTVNVNSGGSVESDASNSNAAVLVANNVPDVTINVDGGSIISVNSGYAISDGSVFDNTPIANSTQITIHSGAITAGTACAIRSGFSTSIVTINGGIISNAAGNNANPAIYMNGGLIENVVVNGGTVQSASAAGYAIQTTGEVRVTDGLVSAMNGRAINLVGTNSKATVTGGTVRTTGTGTAISTATTNPETVTNASIEVTGGTVASSGGFALNITGANSKVNVSGNATVSTAATASSSSRHAINADGLNSEITISGDATISATGGYAINTITAASNAKVVVEDNAKVSSSTNRAINTLGSNSSIEVSGNSQVWTFSTNNAIYASGTVELTGGFVFAYYWVNANNVINKTPTVPGGSSTLVVAWNRNPSNLTYREGSPSSLNPDLSNAYNGAGENFWWHNIPPYRSGISYDLLGNNGFFYIPGVAVVKDVGLIFNASNGNMYYNIDGSNTLSSTNLANPYSTDPTWHGEPGKLSLNGFSWSTGASTALTIVNGNVIIELANLSVNYFASHPFSTGNSVGISTSSEIEITGGGMLTASGRNFGIRCRALQIVSGTVEASGTSDALAGSSFLALQTYTLPAAYTYWINKASAVPPSGEGTQSYFNAFAPGSVPFTIPSPFPHDPIRYVKIVSGAFALVDDETITGTVWSPLTTQTATITLYDDTMLADLVGEDVSGWFTDLPAGIYVIADALQDGDEITLTFSGTPAEVSNAPFNITIPENVLTGGNAIQVIFNPNAQFDIAPYVVTLKLDANGIFHVMQDGTGDGSSWTNAYWNVADPMLLAARQYSGAIPVGVNDTIREIWVAQGTYYPMHSAAGYNMATHTFPENTPGNRNNAFVLVRNVQLYGGFPEDANDDDNAPHGTFTPADARATRNWFANPTILSGDIGAPSDNTDNCYHVVISAGEVGMACIDGFTITGGNAVTGGSISVNGQIIEFNNGGGMYNRSSSPTLTHVTISGNSAIFDGGGMYNFSSSPTLTNVTISGNSVANSDGGGMWNWSSSPTLTNVTISGNSAGNDGGGMYNASSSPQIRNSIISGNTATSGGNNVYNFTSSTPQYYYSLVQRNSGTGATWDSSLGTNSGNNLPCDADPLFVAPQLASAAPTLLGDYRLQPTSPCINAGNNAHLPAGITTDLGGNPRIVFNTVDLGAYEAQIIDYSLVEHFQFEVTVPAGGTFAIPLSGYIGGNATSKTYNWNINWGDDSAIENATGMQTGTGTTGIPHTYTAAGTYTITITPAGSKDAWLAAFGFYNNTTGANANANKNLVTKIISPLTPLMTRTQAQLTAETAPNNEWAYTFYNCTNLTMGDAFNFSEDWDDITRVGASFASNMFSNCSGANFMVNDLFKFPVLAPGQVNNISVFDNTFSNLGTATTQTRTATSIINGNETPSSNKSTFWGSDCFIDRPCIPVNWGGDGGCAVITIETHPAATTCLSEGYIADTLFVVASVTEAATLGYQWYSNTTNSHTGGAEITGASNAKFPVPATLTEGTYYYYCIVSADKGAKPDTSNVAVVTVTLPFGITATKSGNGSITPAGDATGKVMVPCGANQKFDFKANIGHYVDSVFVNGIYNAQAVKDGYYTFVNVINDATIHVTFAINSYTITAIATPEKRGFIDPPGVTTVVHNANQTFTYQANAPHRIAQVLIDGVNDEAAVTTNSYTFTNVTANHTIEVVFDCPEFAYDTVNDFDTYHVVEVAGICWTKENLRATKYQDGTNITPEPKKYYSSSYYDENQNVIDFGLLYDWYSVVVETRYATSLLCPAGWRLPTSDELAALNMYPAINLRNATYWLQPNNNTNLTEFDSRGAGFFNSATQRFEDLYGFTAYWSSDASNGGTGIAVSLTYYCNQIEMVEMKLTDAISVRCVIEEN